MANVEGDDDAEQDDGAEFDKIKELKTFDEIIEELREASANSYYPMKRIEELRNIIIGFGQYAYKPVTDILSIPKDWGF